MPKRGPGPSWSDERLVEACLDGSGAAWNALVEKYKNFVWAIVLRYGIGEPEAADVFQAVWLDIYNDLPQLRNREAVKPWLASVVRNKCFHWKRKSDRRRHMESSHDEGTLELLDERAEDPEFAADLERQQLVREAMLQLNDRCRDMVRMLFFQQPPLPYAEVAERLGLAVGSIGFIRGRCLKALQKALSELGLQ